MFHRGHHALPRVSSECRDHFWRVGVGQSWRAPKKNATINLELVLLRRAFNIADAKFPRVSKLAETNVRKGFLMPEDYVLLMTKLPEHARPVFQFAYRTGCRLGEILNLQWRNINLTDNLVRLEPGETKNDEARTIPMTSDLVRMFEALPHCSPYVFTKDGKRIKSIRRVWNSTVKEANIPDTLFHDLRRTGVRNFIRAGVPEVVAMSISGHKTRSVFDRYNIVSEMDKKDAMVKLEAAQTNLERQAEQKLPGVMDRFMVKTD
jgi:integrase